MSNGSHQEHPEIQKEKIRSKTQVLVAWIACLTTVATGIGTGIGYVARSLFDRPTEQVQKRDLWPCQGVFQYECDYSAFHNITPATAHYQAMGEATFIWKPQIPGYEVTVWWSIRKDASGDSIVTGVSRGVLRANSDGRPEDGTSMWRKYLTRTGLPPFEHPTSDRNTESNLKFSYDAQNKYVQEITGELTTTESKGVVTYSRTGDITDSIP
jgi:hypothetical protein